MKIFMAAVFAVALVLPAAAQRPDSTRADSARGDTTDYSALFLKSYEEGRVRVPVFPRLGRPTLLPALARLVFDRDSIEWHNAETVSDVLTKIPGVFVWRGGWIGRPEPVNYQGRGAGSTEFLIDGMPYLSLGPDSVSVDPSILPLTFFDRIEVERLPGLLRVYLYSRRHDRLPAQTRIGVAAGDFQIARYIAALERRTPKGFGFVVAAEHLAVPLRTGDDGTYSNTQGWLQASWVPPKGSVRAMLQLFRGGPKRSLVRAFDDQGNPVTPTDTLIRPLAGKRTDVMASIAYQPRSDGTGTRAALFAGSSSWTEDSTALILGGPDRHVRYLDQNVKLVGAEFGIRSRTSSIEGRGWYRSRWTPVEVRASAAVAPVPTVALAVEGSYQRHDGSRTSRGATVRAGLSLPLGLKVTGMGRLGQLVRYPMLRADTAVSQTDLGAIASIGGPRLAAEVGYWRTAGSRPEGYPMYPSVDSIRASGTTNWLTVSARLAPLQWFVLDGWYSNPVGADPEGLPPTHSIVNATIQSKYLPTFRSGIFALKLQGSMETWGTGVLGRDAKGNAIPLKGATFFRAQIQFKIGSFIAYYDRVNLQASRLGYLPGLPLLRLASTFGVRWEFTN